MNNLWRVFIIIFLLLNTFVGLSAQEKHKSFKVSRKELNSSISPWKIYFSATTLSSSAGEFYVTVMIYRGEKISYRGDNSLYNRIQIKKQIIPYWYKWQLRGKDNKVTHEWLAYFMKDRDSTYHTIVTLPVEGLQRSYLAILMKDVDGDGIREDITFELDMTDYDWSGTQRSTIQDFEK